MELFPTKEACKCGNFVGSRGVAQGYIYRGHTIRGCKCKLYCGCGIRKGKPVYPCDIIGTFNLEFTIINPEYNKMLCLLHSCNEKGYLFEAKRLSGRVFSDMSLTLNMSDSKDFYLPACDTIVISGRVPGGLRNEKWSMAVLGGTGDFKHAHGEAKVKRLVLINGSGFGETWRMSFVADDIRDPEN